MQFKPRMKHGNRTVNEAARRIQGSTAWWNQAIKTRPSHPCSIRVSSVAKELFRLSPITVQPQPYKNAASDLLSADQRNPLFQRPKFFRRTLPTK